MARAYALPTSERLWQPGDAAKLRIRELVADFSIEVTPATAGKHGRLPACCPRRPGSTSRSCQAKTTAAWPRSQRASAPKA